MCNITNLIIRGINIQFSSVQLLSRVWLFATPWIAAREASLSITNSRSSLKLTSINHICFVSYQWRFLFSSVQHFRGTYILAFVSGPCLRDFSNLNASEYRFINIYKIYVRGNIFKRNIFLRTLDGAWTY